MKKIIMIMLILFALVAGIFTGCVQQSGGTGEKVTDQLGREVYLPPEVERVVSLWPEATAALYALQVGDKIVGVDSYSNTSPILTRAFPQVKNLIELGNVFQGTLSMEKLAELKADVILMATDHPDIAERIQKSLGIPVVCVRVHPPPQRKFSFDLLTIIGTCVGKEKRAAEIKDYLEQRLSRITSVTSEIPDSEKSKAYQAFALDLLRTMGYFDIIELGGGKSVAAGATTSREEAWITVSLEDILRWNPDVIILHGFGKFTPEDVQDAPGWQHLKAVKERKVYRLTLGWMGYDPAGFVINVMQYAKAFYPVSFKDLDIEKEANELFKKLYGIDGLYSQLKKECRLSDI
jgi:iron complex transport system substrate-binding protein